MYLVILSFVLEHLKSSYKIFFIDLRKRYLNILFGIIKKMKPRIPSPMRVVDYTLMILAYIIFFLKRDYTDEMFYKNSFEMEMGV